MAPHHTEENDNAGELSHETFGRPRELTSEPGDLPESYGETRVVLLPVDPYVLHAYWEVTFVELEKAKDKLGDEYGRSQAVLRCYDVTSIIFDGTNAHGTFDVHIDLQAKNWYVSLRNPEKSYFVELGFRTEDGQFFALARSNIAETPRARPAPKSDEHYMLVAGDYDLFEAVPAPIDVQPHKIASPCPPLPGTLACKLHAVRGVGRRGFYTSRPRRLRKKSPILSDHEKGNATDLTEMSEKRFTFGVSSKVRQ